MILKDVLKMLSKQKASRSVSAKQSRIFEAIKDKFITKLARSLKTFDFLEYSYGSFQHKQYANKDITYDESWKVVEDVYDKLVADGFDPETKKMFSGYDDEPRWYWQINIPIANCPDFIHYWGKQISIRMNWAEPDTDCTPMQTVSVNKVWVCNKK